MRRRFRAALGVWLLASGAAGAADVDPPYAAVIERVRADRGLQRFYRLCPGDFAGRVTPRVAAADSPREADCRTNPELCFRQCAERDGKACFQLAHAMETAKPPAPYDAVEPLYAVACALGEPGGCTNRAAALRNGDDPDPLERGAESAERCEYRSFRYACREGDAWGCAMLGQAAMNGEGHARSLALAKRHFAKACQINPDFAACHFAKAREAEMK